MKFIVCLVGLMMAPFAIVLVPFALVLIEAVRIAVRIDKKVAELLDSGESEVE